MFEQLASNLRKALSNLSGKGRLTPEIIDTTLRDIRRVLLSADVNYKVASALVKEMSEAAKDEKVLRTLTPEQTMIKVVRDVLTGFLSHTPLEPDYHSFQKPLKIMLVGLQGSGKTTTAAKIASYLKTEKSFKNPALVACDTVRPAAVQQLKTLAEENGFAFVGGKESPFENAREALNSGQEFDLLVFDTQGRLHIDDEMLEELKKLYGLIQPNLVFLVIDSMYGQEALNVAQRFNEETPLDGIILTKLDGDAKGGAAISAKFVTGVPVIYVSIGEKVGDFDLFEPERYVSRILGMGDVLALIKKAEKELDAEKAQEAQKKLLEGKFDLNDYLEQLREVKKLGGLQFILDQMPSEFKKFAGVVDDNILKRTEAIILSMTPEERAHPEIINGSRRERIAKGSGTTLQDVNQLLKSFYEMKKFFKKAKKLKKRRFGLKLPF
ncbi:MAG: signal recognition particle protein [Actinobacteria bacterium]|nr:signal recognition particle protein [Actinomycetota bacterium]